ncbi:hypothetical protein F4677DRAFT_428432 [Hypoxylon crocopeplum]|nr:hypothetical protein F4677DRAFT_428432 [Hypoxylon crocopeplum]
MARSFLLFLASAFGLASAQSYPNQSAPFNLVLQSSENSTLNGMKLSACHTGAAVESLCLDVSSSEPQWQTFYFNASAEAPTDPNYLIAGLVTWTFTGGIPVFTQNTAIGFNYNPASNLVFPIFNLGVQQTFSFTEDGFLAVGANINDAVSPPEPFENYITYLVDRWAICKTYQQGYGYTALQFVMGDQGPQNPSCQLVTVKREFV